MSDAGWAGFLDSLESELHAVERASRGNRMRNVLDFVPPDLGPLPRELAERARLVLADVNKIADSVRAEMHRTTVQLAESHAMDPRGPRGPTSFDSKA